MYTEVYCGLLKFTEKCASLVYCILFYICEVLSESCAVANECLGFLRVALCSSGPFHCSYIHVYGHQFSKQDHILFIKLAFELLTNCALETTHIHSLASLLCTLLK